MTNDELLNDFAIRSFRDVADEEYISARMAFRAKLVTPCLWLSHQAIEKYLKCILLLNRIPAKDVKHSLGVALDAIRKSRCLDLDLTHKTQKFIEYLDEQGRFRYLEVSHVAFGLNLVELDRSVWELRQHSVPYRGSALAKLKTGSCPQKVRIEGGYLEQIVDSGGHPAREPLLWSNAFFGKRQRRHVKIPGWMRATNSPLYLNPQILDEVLKYVYIPGNIADGYRRHKKPW